jgi:hypothetical protein
MVEWFCYDLSDLPEELREQIGGHQGFHIAKIKHSAWRSMHETCVIEHMFSGPVLEDWKKFCCQVSYIRKLEDRNFVNVCRISEFLNFLSTKKKLPAQLENVILEEGDLEHFVEQLQGQMAAAPTAAQGDQDDEDQMIRQIIQNFVDLHKQSTESAILVRQCHEQATEIARTLSVVEIWAFVERIDRLRHSTWTDVDDRDKVFNRLQLWDQQKLTEALDLVR